MRKLSPLFLLMLWLASAARASALLKPTTGATQALKPKSLEVRAQLHGAFTATTVTTTTVTTIYANLNASRIEADFIYKARNRAEISVNWNSYTDAVTRP